MVAAWAGVATWLLVSVRPPPLPIAALGAAIGVLIGWLQRRSVRAAPDAFASAASALEVRRAFKTNPAGRAAIAASWIGGVLLVLAALAQTGSVPLVFLAGYTSLLFMRDLLSLLPLD